MEILQGKPPGIDDKVGEWRERFGENARRFLLDNAGSRTFNIIMRARNRGDLTAFMDNGGNLLEFEEWCNYLLENNLLLKSGPDRLPIPQLGEETRARLLAAINKHKASI